MKTTIAIGILGLLLASNRAAAQTAVERQQILRGFEHSVVDYSQRQRFVMFPEALEAAPPAPKIFTLPVAMVFRQIIGDTVIAHEARALPETIVAALPKLPQPLHYQLHGTDLEIRDGHDAAVAVLKDAFGMITVRD